MRSVLGIILAIFITCSAASALNYVDTALLAGSKNYIKNGGAEQGRAGWQTYADAAGTTPVDCTGGSPSSTWTTSATTPLSGQYSFLWTHGAANRQGEGFAYTFTIDKADQGKQHTVSFDYEVASGTFTAGVVPIGGATAVDSDVEVFIYDTVNAQIIQPSNLRLLGSSGQQRFTGTFQAASNSTVYRLCGHNATTTTSAFSLRADSFRVSPQVVTVGPAITDFGARPWTPTGSWSTNTTYSGAWRQVGDTAEYYVHIALSGAPTSATLTINLPSGQSVDTSKISGTGGTTQIGSGGGNRGGNAEKLYVTYNNATSVIVSFQSAASGTSALGSVVNATAPVTWASGDSLDVYFKLPISGWSSGNTSAQAGDDTRQVSMSAKATGSTSIGASNTTIVFNSAFTDSHGILNTGTGVSTIPSAGVYEIDAMIYWAANTTTQYFEAHVLAAGTDYLVNQYWKDFATNKEVDVAGHILLPLRAGDTVTIQGRVSSSASSTQANGSFLSIRKLSGGAQLTAADTIAARYTSTSTANITGTDTQINFDTKDYDTMGAVTTGASWKFTAPIPGKYIVKAKAETSNTGCTSTSSHFTLSVYKNNGSRAELLDDRICNITGGYRKVLAGSTSINLVAGDYIDVRISDGDATTHALAAFATDNVTSIEIERIGN
jgi:hypothetical protein